MAYTPIQPDSGTQTGTPYKAAIEGSIGSFARLAGLFAPHEQDTPDMTVLLEAGALFSGTTLTEVAAQNSAIITAPTGSDHRIDRVVIDALTGAASVITGTPGALPRTAPAISTGKLPICQVALEHGMTAITNALITDERVMGGGGGGEAIKVDGVYQNLGTDPATELGYGVWTGFPLLVQYPPAQNTTYVKATSEGNAASIATDPGNSLIGTGNFNWLAVTVSTNQRFHIDTGMPCYLLRVYYENYHSSGTLVNRGVRAFTLWGSNNPSAFADLVYSHDTGWTQLTADISELVEHIAADQADPHYFNVTPLSGFRYYAFKFATAWGGAPMGLRRIELQCGFYQWLRTA